MQEIRLQEIREVANLQQQNPTSLTSEQIQHLQVGPANLQQQNPTSLPESRSNIYR